MSGRKVNYNLRTSKSVERRMILDAIKVLFKDVDKNERRYIGFGSYYFTDFKLFHRELDIDTMISIEGDHTAQARVEFNKPYKCINIEIGQSVKKLPKIDWKNNFVDIVWTDYDQSLSTDMFTDCETIISSIKHNSVYIITCRRRLEYENWEEVKKTFGDLLPPDSNQKDLPAKNSALLIKRMFNQTIISTLSNRNASLSQGDQLNYKPLFFFSYNDGGADMITIGGTLVKSSYSFSDKERDLSTLNFIKDDDSDFQLLPPNLTYKEVYYINSHLPDTEQSFKSENNIKFIPESDRMNYLRLYKYLPNYMDVTS